MKNFTLLFSLLCCFATVGIQAQSEKSSSDDGSLTAVQKELLQASQMNHQQAPTALQQVLLKMEQAELDRENGELPRNFTPEEQNMIDSYFGSNLAPMEDFTPTAGTTETFNPAVGDHFFDPGGPGGSGEDDAAGNYPDCNCDTFTTLANVSEIEFLYFNVFATFDYLIIYDGTDTTGNVLFDNGDTGANSGDITLSEMIASNGSATFTSTTGNFHFEFHSSSVVNRGGWDVEIISASGGGGDPFPAPYCGPIDFSSSVEPITLVNMAGIDNVTDATVGGTPAHEDFTDMVGEVEQDGTYTITLEGNTNGNFENGLTVFIDWNQNELLDDPGEIYEIPTMLDNSTGTDGQQVSGTITVPADAVLGQTRMRVKKKFLSPNSDPCVPGSGFGQAEDYSLNISAAASTGCTDPIITMVDGPDSVCEGTTATLTATHDGSGLNWYDAATGGNLLGSGDVYETSELSATTSFWAESSNTAPGSVSETGGARVAPTSNSSSSVNSASNPWGLSFDATEDFMLNSVDVFLAGNMAGDLTIQLKDNTLAIIDEVTIAAPAGNSSSPVQFTIPLDFVVPAGTDYNLVAETSPVEMIREFSSEHPGFPYPIGTVGSVIGGTLDDDDGNDTVYYFFYNWTVTPQEFCYSERMEKVVTVNEAPEIPVGAPTQTFIDGETLADLEVTGTDLTWYSDPAGTMVIPDTTPLVDGTTYYVSQSAAGCESDLLAIFVEIDMGIQENAIAGFSVYPNPAINQITLEAAINMERVSIHNLLGQEVVSHKINSTSAILNISGLKTGIYFIKVSAENAVETYRLIKK